ncbi:hypothetical protein ACHAP3_002580 [Botrytis cinerea]
MATEQPHLDADSNITNDAFNSSSSNFGEAEIPDRIKCIVPIYVRPSLIDPKNTGLFVDKAVSAGDILLKVEKPLFAIVEETPMRETTCDNCFAYQGMEELLGTVSTAKKDIETAIPFNKCGSCRVFYYCNKKCREEAWEHHHKYECLILVKFLATVNLAKHFIERTDFRFALRFLCMARAGRLTKELMRDFYLAPIGNLRDFVPSMEASYRRLSLNMKLLAMSPVHEDEVLQILCFAVHQSIEMFQPFICQFNRRDTSYENTSSLGSIVRGKYFEPFTTIMRNDCNANTHEYFDGTTYILQANCGIPANTEITRRFSYSNDYKIRRLQFMETDKLDCKCNLCIRGNLGPIGDLRERMLSVHIYNHKPRANKEQLTKQLTIDNKVVTDLSYNGFGYDCPGLRSVYMSIFSDQFDLDSRTKTLDYKESLRLLLTVYYFIDQVACPAPSPEERIKVLYFLIVIASSTKDSRFKVSNIVLTMRKFIYHWRLQLAHYSEQLGGPNTKIAIFHRSAFKKDLEAGYIPVSKDKDALVKDLNGWFKLLDLDEITSEQIFRTQRSYRIYREIIS